MASLRHRIIIPSLLSLCLPVCGANGQKPQDKTEKIRVAQVEAKAVTLTQRYVCRIHARRHIQVQSLVAGRVASVPISEGQAVKRGDTLFLVEPPPDKDRPDAKEQGARFAVKAPFDGLIGRLLRPEGSVVQDGDALTTLSDNSTAWVYFNVPESRYLEYMAEQGQDRQGRDVELILSDRSKFPEAGKIGAIDATVNAATGGVAFRADFPNPKGILRHGQSGIVSMKRVLQDAVVIPQGATLEDQARRYVYVVGKDRAAHRREIAIQAETDDDFVVKEGLRRGDRIVVDGVRSVHDGDRVE